jgi:chemotaxis family two-component system response regulator Rcp1
MSGGVMKSSYETAPIEILLVEDNEGDIELTRIAFEEGNVRANLSVAHDGAEALDVLSKRGNFANAVEPDLILLDINMPRMNGLEFLDIVKQDERLKVIPVVMLTSSNARADIIASYRGHANGYILKPLGIEEGAITARTIERFWKDLAVLPSRC